MAIKITDIKPIPCDFYIFKYTEQQSPKTLPVNKVAISKIKNRKEVLKIIDLCSSHPDVLTMYEKTYNELFEPLFKNIHEHNSMIKQLLDEYYGRVK